MSGVWLRRPAHSAAEIFPLPDDKEFFSLCDRSIELRIIARIPEFKTNKLYEYQCDL